MSTNGEFLEHQIDNVLSRTGDTQTSKTELAVMIRAVFMEGCNANDAYGTLYTSEENHIRYQEMYEEWIQQERQESSGAG